jgi:hypothetical protein
VIILPVTIPLRPSSKGLRRIASGLQDRGFATFVAELLSPEETEHGYHNFDFEMLADRISEVTRRLRRELPFADLPLGYFGTSTDAAALTIVAAQADCPAGALVMCDGSPELASAALPWSMPQLCSSSMTRSRLSISTAVRSPSWFVGASWRSFGAWAKAWLLRRSLRRPQGWQATGSRLTSSSNRVPDRPVARSLDLSRSPMRSQRASC